MQTVVWAKVVVMAVFHLARSDVWDLACDRCLCHESPHPSEGTLVMTSLWSVLPQHQRLFYQAQEMSAQTYVDRLKTRKNVVNVVCHRRTKSRVTCWSHDDFYVRRLRSSRNEAATAAHQHSHGADHRYLIHDPHPDQHLVVSHHQQIPCQQMARLCQL